MRTKVTNALIEMGMPAKLSGFRYIVEAVCMFDEEERWMDSGITSIYHYIAKKHGTTASAVERTMRYAFSGILEKGNHEAVKKYLAFGRTGNSNLLTLLYFKLSETEQEGN